MSETAIAVRDLHKSFDGTTVLDGIDLDIHDGEVTLLLGENGSGKTVFLSCLAGGLHPTAERIDVFSDSPKNARSNLSFMLQGGLLLTDLSGRENAKLYADFHPHATDGWEDIADRLGITDDLDEPVANYSGGMVRKLELAITLGVNVPLYLLDEPTAELDLSAIDRVHALIEERRQAGQTVVLSSHTPSDILIADRIVFIREGSIVTTGDPEDLRASVPNVALARTREDAEALREYVIDHRLFESAEGRRGFIHPENEQSLLPEETEISEATWTDLFNYYAYIEQPIENRVQSVPRKD